jgi:hypothetical protein
VEDKINAYTFWQGNLKERELARRGHRWADNIKIDVKEIDWEGVDSILVLGLGTNGCLLRARLRTFGGIYWLAYKRLASPEGRCWWSSRLPLRYHV